MMQLMPMSSTTDEDDVLVHAAAEGDRGAFGELYVRYARMVHGSPEGLPRGTALTPREAIPPSCCAVARPPPRAISASACLRVISPGYPFSLLSEWLFFQQASLKESAQIRRLIIQRSFLQRPHLLQFGVRFLFSAERGIGPS